MFNNFFNFFRLCVGFKLFIFLCVFVLTIITFYQLIITLFTPCFGNAFILLIEYVSLVTLSFWLIFGL